MMDIYFLPEYGKLNESVESGKSVIYTYESDLGRVYYMFIKRIIPDLVNNEVWYDIITPYGYGGPIICDSDDKDKNQLILEFQNDFGLYCKNHNIVSEFIRFHPIINNAYDFKEIYHLENIRNTIGTDLTVSDDPTSSEFSKSCRKTIRQLIKKGLTYKITENPDNLDEFKKIYYATMDRNKATDFYYFDQNYFEDCISLLKTNIVLIEALYEGKTIAMGCYFAYRNIIHIHLSGTLNEFIQLSPAYILKYGITKWGKEKGYKIIHHGGGRTNLADDPLLLFKRKFGSLEYNFFIGKKIWNHEVYDILVQKNNKTSSEQSSTYFPAYRFQKGN